MSFLSDPFKDLKPITSTGTVPKGTCDGLKVTTAGTIAFTTVAGTAITGYVAQAGEIIPVRVISVDNLGSATVFAGYH